MTTQHLTENVTSNSAEELSLLQQEHNGAAEAELEPPLDGASSSASVPESEGEAPDPSELATFVLLLATLAAASLLGILNVNSGGEVRRWLKVRLKFETEDGQKVGSSLSFHRFGGLMIQILGERSDYM